MDEKIFNYNGDIWSVITTKGPYVQYVVRCLATGKDPDFPVSEVRFTMDQLLRNDNISENPPKNVETGGHITMFHGERGVDMLKLLAELAVSKRIK